MSCAASIIEHTLLAPNITGADVERLCAEAVEHGFLAVCVNPVHVARAAAALDGAAPFVVSVAGFPTGAVHRGHKAAEAARAVADGAREIDMVLRLDALLAGDDALAEQDVAAVVDAAGDHAVKVIVESGLLDDEQLARACGVVERAGARFAKTSTGFFGSGATVHAVGVLRANLPEHIGVKASGGIRTLAQARQLMQAGATRIGCSASVDIARQEAGEGT